MTGSVRSADLRFLLPSAPATALVLAEVPGLASALLQVGVGTPEGSPPDVIVVDRRRAREAFVSGAGSVVVLGRAPRRLPARLGYQSTPYLVRPGVMGPRLVVPLRSSGALRHALERTAGTGVLARLRRRLAGRLLRWGMAPPAQLVTVASRHPGPPYLVAAAVDAGLVALPEGWVLLLGEGDDLQRALFVLTDRRGAPRQVVKFSRSAAGATALDHDAEGLALIAATGSPGDHAPRVLGRLDTAGTPAAVETAAPGGPLTTYLMSDAIASGKGEIIDAVAGWLLEVASNTRTPPTSLAEERRRLTMVVVPPWGVDGSLVDAVGDVPGVLAHHDLGTWNILHEGGTRFCVVDWESARRPALPLWDLTYFLVDALTAVDGPCPKDVRTGRALSLLRGTGPGADVLFGWLRRAAGDLGLAPDLVGPLVTLCWLHHGLSPVHRADAAGDTARSPGHLARLAEPWLTDPALGPTWAAWRDAGP